MEKTERQRETRKDTELFESAIRSSKIAERLLRHRGVNERTSRSPTIFISCADERRGHGRRHVIT